MLSRRCGTILSSQVDCVEAIYNLGLVNIHLGLPGDSLQAFEKLHTIIPNNTEVIYHIANLYEVREPHQDRLEPDSGQGLARPSRICSGDFEQPTVCMRCVTKHFVASQHECYLSVAVRHILRRSPL